MQANISVSARSGSSLSEIRIYNGRELFRRFEVDGPHFYSVLLLDAFVHRNLVLVAVDSAGGTAVAKAKTWKGGTDQVTFCGDRVNDVRVSQPQLLCSSAHQIFAFSVARILPSTEPCP